MSSTSRRWAGLLFAAVLGQVWPAHAAEAPGLVLLVSVDQLRRDRAQPSLPGGIGRLTREGRVYRNALLAHALTETCPGHVTMLSGRHPGPAGAPGNRFIDRDSGERFYCVEDPAPDARVFGSSDGRSPRLLRVDFLGDWMKAVHPETRVFSVSAKDRAAVTLGGHQADAAYWLASEGVVGFTTSRYYSRELSAWVRAWNGADPAVESFLAALPERRATPFLDDLTLEFARELVRNERLGRGEHPDLLAISLSATDFVGHLYGPESPEADDALRRLDASLQRFLDFLESEVGVDRLLVVLTADHGVLPLPERLQETGRGECPVEGGRVGLRRIGLGLAWRLHRSLGPLLSLPKSWLQFAGSQLTVNRRLVRERGVSVEEVARIAERYLEAHPAIAEVWTAEEIRSGTGPFAELYRNSFDPERSGDLVVQVESGCLITSRDTGTTHGSPYVYDRAVPLVFYGHGVPAGQVEGPAATVDIAPTLARLLGIDPPEGLDGRVLSD